MDMEITWCVYHCVYLCMLVSLQETFIRAQVWLKELEKQYIPGSTVIWLVGNKGDLSHYRQVSVQVYRKKISYLLNHNQSQFSIVTLISYSINIQSLISLSYRKDRAWPGTGVYPLKKHQPCQGIKSVSCCWLQVSKSVESFTKNQLFEGCYCLSMASSVCSLAGFCPTNQIFSDKDFAG